VASSKSNSDTGCGILGLIVLWAIGYSVWWVGYTFFYAPSHRDTSAPPPQISADATSPPTQSSVATGTAALEAARLANGQTAVLGEIAQILPDSFPRLEVMEGSNLDVYLTRKEFEDVAFPDRPSVLERVGKAWCKEVNHSYLPKLRIRDIRTGQEFGSFSCVSEHVAISEQQSP
jgi:hypothetical protein